MAVGGGAAYKGYQKIDNGISQGLQNLTGIKARENAAQKLADERAGVRKKAEDKAFRDEFNLPEDFATELTNNRNYNDVVTNYAKKVEPMAVDLYNKAQEAQSSGNSAMARDYQNRYNKLKNSFASVNKNTKLVNEKLAWYMENKGKMLPSDKRHKIFDGLIKSNYMLTPTESGDFKMIVGLDRDGDGKISAEEAKAKDDYLRDGFQSEGFDIKEVGIEALSAGGYDGFMKQPILEKGGLIDTITSNVGVTTTDSLGNYKVTTEFLSKGALESLDKQIRLQLSKPEVEANVMSMMGKLDDNGYLKGKYGKADIEEAVSRLKDIAINKYNLTTSKSGGVLSKEELLESKKSRSSGAKSPKGISVGRVEGGDGYTVSKGGTTFDINRAKKLKREDYDSEKAFQTQESINQLLGEDVEKIKVESLIVNGDDVIMLKDDGGEVPIPKTLNTWVAAKYGYPTFQALKADIPKVLGEGTATTTLDLSELEGAAN